MPRLLVDVSIAAGLRFFTCGLASSVADSSAVEVVLRSRSLHVEPKDGFCAFVVSTLSGT